MNEKELQQACQTDIKRKVTGKAGELPSKGSLQDLKDYIENIEREIEKNGWENPHLSDDHFDFDYHYIMCPPYILVDRLETDQEQKKRIFDEYKRKLERKKSYEKLKKEFENE